MGESLGASVVLLLGKGLAKLRYVLMVLICLLVEEGRESQYLSYPTFPFLGGGKDLGDFLPYPLKIDIDFVNGSKRGVLLDDVQSEKILHGVGMLRP